MAPFRPCLRRSLQYCCANARAGAPCISVAAFAPGHNTKLYRDPIHVARALRTVSRTSQSYLGACPVVSQCRIATHPADLAFLLSRYNDCIVTHLSGHAALMSRYNWLYQDPSHQQGRARTLLHTFARSRPCRGPLAAPSVLLCHDTVCCIVTKPGNWAVAHSNSCNFLFFFSFVHLLENPKFFFNYKYIFFIFQLNKINLLKFILFIFLLVLHTVKP